MTRWGRRSCWRSGRFEFAFQGKIALPRFVQIPEFGAEAGTFDFPDARRIEDPEIGMCERPDIYFEFR